MPDKERFWLMHNSKGNRIDDFREAVKTAVIVPPAGALIGAAIGAGLEISIGNYKEILRGAEAVGDLGFTMGVIMSVSIVASELIKKILSW